MSKEHGLVAVVGGKYLSGNSFFPDTCEVVAIVGWDGLSALEQKDAMSLNPATKWDVARQEKIKAETYVVYRRNGRAGYAGRRWVTSLSVFEATSYTSHDSMVECYARKAVA